MIPSIPSYQTTIWVSSAFQFGVNKFGVHNTIENTQKTLVPNKALRLFFYALLFFISHLPKVYLVAQKGLSKMTAVLTAPANHIVHDSDSPVSCFGKKLMAFLYANLTQSDRGPYVLSEDSGNRSTQLRSQDLRCSILFAHSNSYAAGSDHIQKAENQSNP